jgi:hypothetical protein
MIYPHAPDYNYGVIVIASFLTALIMTVFFMPIAIWATRKMFGNNPWFEGLLWGSLILGPLSDRLIAPLF